MSGVRGNHGESIQSSGKTQLADFGDLIEKGSSSQRGKGFLGNTSHLQSVHLHL